MGSTRYVVRHRHTNDVLCPEPAGPRGRGAAGPRGLTMMADSPIMIPRANTMTLPPIPYCLSSTVRPSADPTDATK
jgi:hypothetical protein